MRRVLALIVLYVRILALTVFNLALTVLNVPYSSEENFSNGTFVMFQMADVCKASNGTV